MADAEAEYKREQDTGIQNGSSDDAQIAEEEIENPSMEPPKKKRRVVKPNPDKKFECKHEGCGKSYSRAEHLYRHQLNREYCLFLLAFSLLMIRLKILPRLYTVAISPSAPAISCDKIFVSDTESDIQLLGHNCTRETHSLNPLLTPTSRPFLRSISMLRALVIPCQHLH